MAIEWFNSRVGNPVITVANYGITFSAMTLELLGRPDYIVIGYNDEQNRIIFKKCDKMEVKRIKFISREKNGNVRISNKNITGFIKGNMPSSLRAYKSLTYHAKWDEMNNYMYIELDSPIEKRLSKPQS